MDDGIFNKFNRIEKDHSAVKARLTKIKKNTNLHEKKLNKRVELNVCIRRGIRDVIDLSYKQTKDGVSIYSLTPSHNITLLTQSLPATVIQTQLDDNFNEVYVPLKFPAWRGLTERVKPYLYQLALAELETNSNHQYHLIPFVCNITIDLEKAIQSQTRDRVDFLRDRLQKGLNEALQRPKDNKVAFWFAFETARRGQPHIQGSLLLKFEELKAARKAFYKFSRFMTPEEKHGLLRFRGSKRRRLFEERGQLYTDLNWADYNLKERAYTRHYYNNLNAIIAVSLPLIKHTSAYYERLRHGFKLLHKANIKPAQPNTNPAQSLWGTW